MKTRNKNTKLRKTKLRKRKLRKTKTRKMKGGSFFFNLFKGFSSSDNEELNQDLKKLSTYKETIRKTIQSMYDNAKDSTKFNENYTLFTTTVNEINKLVIEINKHRSKPTNSTGGTGGTGATNAVAAGAGLVGAGAAAIVGLKDAKNAVMGSPQP
jgi:hypothetical protein